MSGNINNLSLGATPAPDGLDTDKTTRNIDLWS